MKVPKSMERHVVGCKWKQESIGMSGADVYFLQNPSGSNYYLKKQRIGQPEMLKAEQERLDWLCDKLPVPDVAAYELAGDTEFLLTTEVKGVHAASSAICANAEVSVRLLAHGLKCIHAVSVDDCPFDETLPVKLAEARRRLENDWVDEDDFDESRVRKTAAELYRELLALRPSEEDLVFTHGDYCMPNIIINHGELGGFIDWGRAGVSDRYQDLALATRSIAQNYGREWILPFFRYYGISYPDEGKIKYYQLLDEFY
ncbi:MAG TPA: APH(3') family aminoglycoside O-phosphotransferase [Bacillales bacterium]|nr:APH(3') family aminoglycoside O-phosphotransferase [Bacillales bacterium]